MIISTRHLSLSLLAAAIVTLSGCACLPSTTAEADKTAETTPPPVASPQPPAVETASEPTPQPPRLPEDGIVAEFSPAQVKLSEQTLLLLARLAETRTPDERLEITGYCNRKDAPVDARDIALMRATAARNELVRLGVPAKSIRVKFNTMQALHAVKVVAK